MKNLSIYNKKALYEEKIAPKIAQIKYECAKSSIPFFFSIAVANDEKSTEYINEAYMTVSTGIELENDRFGKFMLVTNDAKFVPPAEGYIAEDGNALLSSSMEEGEDGVSTDELLAENEQLRAEIERLKNPDGRAVRAPLDFAALQKSQIENKHEPPKRGRPKKAKDAEEAEEDKVKQESTDKSD